MANILYDPWLNPVRFYLPNPSTYYSTRFFEDFQFYDTIVPWEQHFDYVQPWRSDIPIKLQLQADFGPHTINVLDEWDQIITSVQYDQFVPYAQDPNLHLYLISLNVSSLPEGVYTLQRISGIDEPLITVSNKIKICSNHAYTLVLDYQDESVFHEGTFFQDSSGTSIFYPTFLVEGALKFKSPASKGAPDFEDQPLDLQTVKATAYNLYDLIIGDRRGVPDWVIDLVNRICTCSTVSADGKSITKPVDNKFEPNEQDGMPTRGWRTEVRRANNRPSNVYVNNMPQNAKVGIVISISPKGFSTDTGGAPYEITDVQ